MCCESPWRKEATLVLHTCLAVKLEVAPCTIPQAAVQAELLRLADAWQASVEWYMQGGHSLWAIPRGHLEILVRACPDLSLLVCSEQVQKWDNQVRSTVRCFGANACSLVLVQPGACAFHRLFH
jgi:hypothetical protein